MFQLIDPPSQRSITLSRHLVVAVFGLAVIAAQLYAMFVIVNRHVQAAQVQENARASTSMAERHCIRTRAGASLEACLLAVRVSSQP